MARNRISGRLVLCALLTCATAVRASTLIPRTFPELVTGADRIVIGTCVQASSFWDERLIFTRYELTVEETLKGEPVPRAEFVSPGGQVGELFFTDQLSIISAVPAQ